MPICFRRAVSDEECAVAQPTIDLGDLPPVLTPKQLGHLLDKTTDALACDRYFGRGIPYTKIGNRVYYLRADVAEYLAANRHSAGR